MRTIPIAAQGRWWSSIGGARDVLPGLAACGVIAAAAYWICRLPALQALGSGMLVIALVIGMLAGHALPARYRDAFTGGVVFARQQLLRLGIILYGTRLSWQDIDRLGSSGMLIDLTMVASTLVLALVAGRFLLKLDPDTVLLVGAGSSICGAAAVLATEPVLNARGAQVTVAVATVVVFGTLATFLYPVLYRAAAHWPLLPGSVNAFGVYIGSTIHEVAQVVAAARAVEPASVDAAVIAKMMRVILLCPFLAAVAVYASLRQRGSGQRMHGPALPVLLAAVPWFAVGFLLVVLLNSILPGFRQVTGTLTGADLPLLVMAMAALGMSTRIDAFRQAGIRPLLLAGILFVWLVGGGAAVNRLLGE